MKTLATFLILSAALLFAAAPAGTWKGSMETQAGNTPVSIRIEPGETLSGTVQIGEYDAKIEQGKLDGDKLSFEINIGPGKILYEGTVAGSEMKLLATGTQGNQYRLNCRRESVDSRK